MFGDYFTPRQLVALTTLADLVKEAIAQVERDYTDEQSALLGKRAVSANIYAKSIAVYLSFALSRSADRGSSICS